MRKQLMSIATIALVLTLPTVAAHALVGVAGTPTVDPEANYTPKLANKYYSIQTEGQLCQMFTPSRQVIANYIDIRAAGSNPGGIVLTIRENDGANMPSGIINIYQPPGSLNDGRNTMSRFTAFTDISVTVGQYYWLCMEGGDGYWYADSPDGGYPTATYNNGLLLHGGIKQAAEDFGFIIYSSNLELPPQQQEVVPSPVTTDTDTNTNTNTNTATNTNSTTNTEANTNNSPSTSGVDSPDKATDVVASYTNTNLEAGSYPLSYTENLNSTNTTVLVLLGVIGLLVILTGGFGLYWFKFKNKKLPLNLKVEKKEEPIKPEIELVLSK